MSGTIKQKLEALQKVMQDVGTAAYQQVAQKQAGPAGPAGPSASGPQSETPGPTGRCRLQSRRRQEVAMIPRPTSIVET